MIENRLMGNGSQAAQYELAHIEARRALDLQANAVDEIRVRSGVLASAAVVMTSFLGSSSVASRGISPLGWLALASFAMTILATALVLWPRSWEFSASSASIIASYIETTNPLSIDQIYRDLALHMQASYDENMVGLERLNWNSPVSGDGFLTVRSS
jgi:hypothetical protein